jgi:hypothetical protein
MLGGYSSRSAGRGDRVSAIQNIRAAQDSVAVLQHQLEEVQRVLEAAEEVAVVGETARRRAPVVVLGIVAVVGLGATVRYVVVQKRARQERSAA